MNYYNQTSNPYDISEYEAKYTTATDNISLTMQIIKENMIREYLIKQALADDTRDEE